MELSRRGRENSIHAAQGLGCLGDQVQDITTHASFSASRMASGIASRVEVWRGGLGRCLCSLLARSFVCGCHIISTMLRFHTPLIKPGGPISGTRLSDKASLMAIHTRSPTNRCRFVR